MNPQQPPRIPSSKRKVVLIAMTGIIVSAMLLLVVLNIDRSPDVIAQQPQRDLRGIESPEPLSEDDLLQGVQVTKIQPQALGAERGWIQVNGPDGKLTRQYRFEALDPLPDGWSKMTKPRIEARSGDRRVVTLEGDEAMIHMPGEKPEAGTLTGNVIIRAYEIDPGETFDPASSTQILHIKTPQAVFDNTRSEIRCENQLLLETSGAQLDGSGLRLLLNEVEQRAEWLEMKHATVRISNAANMEEADSTTAAPSESRTEAAQTQKSKRASSANGKNKQQAAPFFYRLTFQKNVRIAQGSEATGWHAMGDELAIVFSLDNKSLGKSLTMGPPHATPDPHPPHALPHSATESQSAHSPVMAPQAALTSLAFALAALSPDQESLFQRSDDDIVITCDGGIGMKPLAASEPQPASADDVQVVLTGAPMRMVDAAQDSVITARSLQYGTLEKRLDLVGDNNFPLTLESPELSARAPRMWLNREENNGAFEGPGWMVARDGGAAPQPAPAQQSNDDIRIEWNQRVVLEFDATQSTSKESRPRASDLEGDFQLRLAQFIGDVHVTNPDIAMRADTMDVAFPVAIPADKPGDSRSTSIESILAKGNVKAASSTDGGEITCQSLQLSFAQSSGTDHRTIPAKLIATQGVQAIDRRQQVVWCDRLDVEFDSSGSTGAASSSSSSAVAVKSLVAAPNVQALLGNGARTFADRLEADPANQTIVLTGNDVMIASERSVIHRGRKVEVRQDANSATWPGAGEFVHFASPVVTPDRKPMPRPLLDGPKEIVATWNDSMTYDAAFGDGAGQITLQGAVRAVSDPGPTEHSTLDADSLTLQFARGESALPATSDQATGDGSRRLSKMIAQGKGEEFAKIESHTWPTPDRQGQPRIFYVAGKHIEFDQQTMEADVNGPGELLVSNTSTGEAAGAAAEPPKGMVALSANGATSFSWSEHLSIKRRAGKDAQFDIDMQGGITVRHRAVDGSFTNITCQRLTALAERQIAPDNAAQPQQDAMDFGGTMTLKELHGFGRVYIDAPTRDIDCGEFDYNVENGVATLIGPPGGTVAVTTQGDATPLRAARIVWNMKEDSITATEISGAPAR